MSKETFMLVSLKEDKAKKLAQAISNPTCRRILDYLATTEATETDIAEKLKIPGSTVHYNLMQLKESKLVEVEEFHYSKKGKEVAHYKLANKYIIIAPKDSSSSFAEALKNILPVSVLLAAGISVWQFFGSKTAILTESSMMQGAGQESMLYAKTAMADAVASAPSVAMDAYVTTQPVQQAVWPWFAYGAFTALVLYYAVSYIRNHILNSD